MYVTLLTLHNAVRWLVVACAVLGALRFAWALLARRPWGAFDDRLARVLIAALDSQLLLGLVLWLFVSPFSPGRGAVAPFFTFVHPASMIAAVVAVHVGRSLSRARAERRHAPLLVALLVAGGAFALAVPWPWTAWARPLLRIGAGA